MYSCYCFWQSLFFKITSVVFQLILSKLLSLFSAFPCFQHATSKYLSGPSLLRQKGTANVKSHIYYLCMLLSNSTQNNLRNSVRMELGTWREKLWVPLFHTSAPKYDQWLQKADLCLLLEHFKCICDNCKGWHWTLYFSCLKVILNSSANIYLSNAECFFSLSCTNGHLSVILTVLMIFNCRIMIRKQSSKKKYTVLRIYPQNTHHNSLKCLYWKSFGTHNYCSTK